jgi:hypothetical protein
MRKWPNDTLAVGDRIEHRGRRLLRVERGALAGKNGADGVRHFARQRNLDENDRIVDQRRMEEGVAAAVGRIDAAAQIVPAVDLVHRLVADDFFQNRGRRRPVDPAQQQEAAIEPR